VILIVFAIEQLLTICVEGCREYFCNPFMLLDFNVIGLSVIFEVAQIAGWLSGSRGIGLLVFARVWRFARVAHGVYEVIEGKAELAEEMAEMAHELEKQVHATDNEWPDDKSEQTAKSHSSRK
jgi:uncharacterized membrane protein